MKVGCLALAPYILIKVGLAVWLGSWGYARATQLTHVPFLGLRCQWPWDASHVQQILAVVAPALVAVFVVWHATRRASAELWFLIMNVLVLVVFLPSPSYVGYLAGTNLDRSRRSVRVVPTCGVATREGCTSVAPDRALDAPLVHGASGRSETLIRSV